MIIALYHTWYTGSMDTPENLPRFVLLAEAIEQRRLADSGLAMNEDERPGRIRFDARQRLAQCRELAFPFEQPLMGDPARCHAGPRGRHPRHILHREPGRGKAPGYTDAPRGCGGIGRRARFRSV